MASNKAQGREIVANEIISFSEDIASKLGVSERTVQREVQIIEKLYRFCKKIPYPGN
jgi:hypothetical protein